MKRAAACFVLLLLVLPSVADEEAASFFTSRGAEALAAGDLKEARGQFEKALTQHADYLPARLGLAKTAHAEGKVEEALRALEVILDAGEAGAAGPAAAEALKEARSVLAEMDRPRLEYRDAVAEYVGSLMALAERSVNGNPELARRCVSRILALRPDHRGALMLKAAITTPEVAPRPKAGEVSLFNGKDLKGWEEHAAIFTVRDGVIRAEATDGSWILRTEQVFKGNYSVEYEARIIGDAGDKPCLILGFGFRKDKVTYEIEAHREYLLFRTRDFTTDQTQKFARADYFRLKTPLDRSKWNVFRVDVRQDVATVSVNGEEFGSRQGVTGEYDGQVMVTAQDLVAEVRRIALLR
jgi:tetratricopeptide (TPR) repeat protein